MEDFEDVQGMRGYATISMDYRFYCYDTHR